MFKLKKYGEVCACRLLSGLGESLDVRGVVAQVALRADEQERRVRTVVKDLWHPLDVQARARTGTDRCKHNTHKRKIHWGLDDSIRDAYVHDLRFTARGWN